MWFALTRVETALNTIIDYNWRAGLDELKTVVSVFLDLKKASDTVNHDILFYKLNYYNVSPCAANLLSSYLHSQHYLVRYGGAQSDFDTLETGVRSSLGQLLFLIYINDLALLKLSSQMVLFADDTTMSAIGSNYIEV